MKYIFCRLSDYKCASKIVQTGHDGWQRCQMGMAECDRHRMAYVQYGCAKSNRRCLDEGEFWPRLISVSTFRNNFKTHYTGGTNV